MAQQAGTVVPRTSAERGNGSDPPARSVRRRRGLPGSRAVVGGLLVATAAVGLFAAASTSGQGPRQTYVVARHELNAGTRLAATDLELVPMELAPSLRARAFSTPR